MINTFGQSILQRMSVQTIDPETLHCLINESKRWDVDEKDKEWFFFQPIWMF